MSDWECKVSVAALIEREGKFLLIEEYINGRWVYNQPAGRLDPHETLEAAVVRETMEESAWEFIPEGVSGLYLDPKKHGEYTRLRVSFYGRAGKHFPDRALDTGIRGTVWLTLDEIRAQAAKLRSPAVLASIEDYVAGARNPLSMVRTIMAKPKVAKSAKISRLSPTTPTLAPQVLV